MTDLPPNRMPADRIEVVAPNLKRRLSGVTATVVRLIPVQARMIGITTTGPGLPPELPHIPLIRAATLPRDRWRVWHARRNTEMALGLILLVVVLLLNALVSALRRWRERLDGGVMAPAAVLAT